MPGRGRERGRGRDSLKPAEAEYICMLGVYVYRLGRFVVLLPVACTEGHRIHRTGQSRTGQGREGQDRAGQDSAGQDRTVQHRAELKLLQTYRTSGWASNMARINVVPDLGTPPMNINGISR